MVEADRLDGGSAWPVAWSLLDVLCKDHLKHLFWGAIAVPQFQTRCN